MLTPIARRIVESLEAIYGFKNGYENPVQFDDDSTGKQITKAYQAARLGAVVIDLCEEILQQLVCVSNCHGLSYLCDLVYGQEDYILLWTDTTPLLIH